MSGSLPRSLLIGALALVMVSSTLFGGALAALTGPGAHPAGTVIHVIILPDGSLSTPAPITRSGNTYTLTQEINGTIVDERNGSTLNGAGHGLNSTGPGSVALGLYGITGVTVEDLNITNASVGISIQNSSLVMVENNAIRAIMEGIASDFTVSLSVVGNHLFPGGATEQGISLQQGSQATVTGNEMYRLYEGVAAHLYQGILVSGNNASRTNTGVDLQESSEAKILSNLADNSTDGIVVYECTQVNVSSNRAVYSNYGIFLDSSSQLTGYGNVVVHSRTIGLLLGSDVGVTLAGTLASYGFMGFDVYETTQFDLKGGTALDSTSNGLYVEYSSNGTFTDLNASGSYYPVYLYYTEGMVVLQNANVSYAGVGYGVYAEFSSLTMIGGSVYGETHEAIYSSYDLQVHLIDLNGSGPSNTYLLYDEYSSSVTVTGGRFTGYYCALNLEVESSVTVTGTTFVNDYIAGSTSFSGVVTLNDLTIRGGTSSTYGWNDDSSASVNVVNGTYQNLSYGLWLNNEQADRVVGANFQNISAWGVNTVYTGSISLSWVRVTGSVATTRGFSDDGSGRESVTNSSFPGLESGVYLSNDGPAWVYNVSSQGSYQGIYVYLPSSLTVEHSNFNSDNTSMTLYTQDATVTNNTATGAAIALYAEYLDQGSVSGNNFSDAKSYAAWFYSDNNLVVSDNNLSGAGSFALAFDHVVAAEAWGNDLSHSIWGFELDNSTGITLVDNRIAGDPWAFSLNNSTSDLFYHNNFINDAKWVFKGTVTQNAWADGYPVGGNYWSGYSGKDLYHGPNQNLPGPDGIGDTPYALGSGNVDPYPLMKPWTSPVLTFSETGLPVGTLWNVTVNGTRLQAAAPDPIGYPQGNGAYTPYDYTVGSVAGYFAQPAKGNGTYTQSDVTIPIHFWTVNYTVTFAETGLPANTTWGVKLSFAGLKASGNASTLALDAANGTWDYQLQAPTGYLASPSSGNLTVRGSAVTLSIVFHPITYQVGFGQQGLPVGLNWTVELPGLNLSGPASGSLYTSLPNGTYAFTVKTTAASSSLSYVPSPLRGNLTVNGSAVSVPIAFTAVNHPTLYAVTFVPTGLPSGRSFNLSAAGRSLAAVTSSVALQLPNGTYSFGVQAPAGWSASPVQGVLTVNGTSVSVSLTFKPVSAPSPSNSGISNGEFLSLLALVIVLAILMVVGWLLYLGGRRKGGGPQTPSAPVGPTPTPPQAWQATPGEPPAAPPPASPPSSP